MNLIALHGFWGSPADFEGVISRLQPKRVWIPNLSEQGRLDSSHGFAEWTENFLNALLARFDSVPVHLLGYSQGARLALHAVLKAPDRFARTLLLSAHPGQLPPVEQQQRLAWIHTWRVKFLEEDWDALVHDWNGQAVFANDKEASKPRVSRESLVQALENWSLLRHNFDWQDLHKLGPSVTWAFGSLDNKFLAVKDRLQKERLLSPLVTVNNAGHRILSDQPEMVAKLMKDGSHAE